MNLLPLIILKMPGGISSNGWRCEWPASSSSTRAPFLTSPAAAAQVLQRASAAEPASRSVREALARAQFDVGRYAEAADNFRMIVEASPSDDYAHFGLGLALARTGHPAAAAEHLALAAAMRPDAVHYTEALRSVRATLRAQDDARQASSGAAVQPARDDATDANS